MKKKAIAIIPLRAGSKGIKGKNKRRILGRPLYQWVLGAAIQSKLDRVYIYTDDKEIISYVSTEYSWIDKVQVLERSHESASDTASTEKAMIEFSKEIKYDFDIICLLQATSPLTKAEDINNALEVIYYESIDSVLTVVKTKRFIWDDGGNSLNYDYHRRPRRQEFSGLNIENGAIYMTTKKAFIKSNNRISGNISLCYMDENTLSEIDEKHDLVVVENLLKGELNDKYKADALPIKLVVFDVDGVFTSGTVGVSSEGELFKSFSLRDGMGLELLRNSGVEAMVMTSENSPIVRTRMEKLKIQHLFLGVRDKFTRLNEVAQNLGISRREIAYVGDDINDLANMNAVGWAFTPNNAVQIMENEADIVLNNSGGDMAIRETINFIIKYNNRFNK